MSNKFVGTILQDNPRVYVATISGQWLLERTTPSWRIDNPETGFQRIVSEKRAKQIAGAVLDHRRTFPNTIVLATDSSQIQHSDCHLTFPSKIRFLVIDGQHRLWAQKFSEFKANYGCVIHVGLSEPEMASLFVEINDNQKRVPSSLRWDLVRLVRPETDPVAVRAADLVEGFNSDETSPLYQRIDMTGEQPEITIKQGSIAPEIETLLNKKTVLQDEGFDLQLEVLLKFFAAVREKDPDGWYKGTGYLYRARVLRALLKLFPEMLRRVAKDCKDISAEDLYSYIKRISMASLSDEKIKATQGNAGIAAIARTINGQIFK